MMAATTTTTTTRCLKWAILLALVSLAHRITASEEQYTFDFTGNDAATIEGAPGKFPARRLQSEDCLYVGANLRCTLSFQIEGANGTFTDVLFLAICQANSQTLFDPRKAAGCSCQAQVSKPGEPPKICPCTVCQEGFGENPINVDCSNATSTAQVRQGGFGVVSVDADDGVLSGGATLTEEGESGGGGDSVSIADGGGGDSVSLTDGGGDSVSLSTTNEAAAAAADRSTPYIANTCTSVDCSGACNGTCALNCADSDTSCIFCANARENQPTVSPTGAANDDILGYSPPTATSGGSREWKCVVLSTMMVGLLVVDRWM